MTATRTTTIAADARGAPAREDARLLLLLALGLALAIFAVYGQVLGHGFLLFDDDDYVTANTHIRQGLTAEGLEWAATSLDSYNWHPVTWVSHMLDVQVFGMRAGGHHATSLLLHALNAVLLLLVLDRMTRSIWRSAFVAALFAFHPLHVESVAWIAERKDVLSTFFLMVTLLAYHAYARRPGLRRYLVVTLLFALGLAAKPMLVTLPFLLLLLDVWPLGVLPLPRLLGGDREASRPPPRLDARARLLEKVPWLALSAASCAITYLAQKHGGAMGPLDRLPFSARAGNAAVSCVLYLAKTVWPVKLSFFYPHPGEAPPIAWALGAAGLLSAITVAVLWRIAVRPYLAVGWLWYLGTLVPVIGLVQVGAHAMADRYTYVPLIGIFIAATWAIAELAARRRIGRRILAPAGAVALGLLMIAAWSRTRDWRDSETLFQRALDVQPDNWLAHNVLGVALYRSGRIEEAAGHYRESVRLNPANSIARVNFGIALSDLGRADEAFSEFSEAARIAPGNALAHYNRGVMLAAKGRVDEAMAAYTEALKLNPALAGAHNNLGGHLYEIGRVDEAITHFRAAVALLPADARSRVNLGIALARAGDRAGSVEQLREALRIDPSDREARAQLDRALASPPPP